MIIDDASGLQHEGLHENASIDIIDLVIIQACCPGLIDHLRNGDSREYYCVDWSWRRETQKAE